MTIFVQYIIHSVRLLDKVPSRDTNTPNHCYRLLKKKKKKKKKEKKSKIYSFEMEVTCTCTIKTTLKEFSYTFCEAHDLDLKGKARVPGSC